jgi:Galactose oxidase, central domain
LDIFGGWGKDTFLNDLYEFDLDTNVWRKIESTGDIPPPRCQMSAFVKGDCITPQTLTN